MPPENRQAIEYFMAQGGTFCVSTGRALPAFAPIAPTIPMNGPTILFNGAAIYDFSAGRYLHTAFLPETILTHLHRILEAVPHAAMEIYHDDNSIHAVNPNDITRHHLHLTHLPTVVLEDIDQVPFPVSKILFEEHPPRMGALTDYIAAQPWAADYEVVLSAANLLELTAHGANKGGMVKKLVELLGLDPRHLYCIGDHAAPGPDPLRPGKRHRVRAAPARRPRVAPLPPRRRGGHDRGVGPHLRRCPARQGLTCARIPKPPLPGRRLCLLCASQVRLRRRRYRPPRPQTARFLFHTFLKSASAARQGQPDACGTEIPHGPLFVFFIFLLTNPPVCTTVLVV